MDTIPLRARVPIYLAALVLAIARTPRDIYDFHARGLGTARFAPWRRKLSAGVTRSVSVLRAIGALLWGHRQALAGAALVGVLLVAPETLRAHDLMIVGVAGQVTVAQLKQEHDQAVAQYETVLARQLDPATTQAAAQKVLNLRARLAAAQGDSNMLAELDRITGGAGARRRGASNGGASLGQQIIDSELGKWLIKNRGHFPSGRWTSPMSSEIGFTPIMGATLTEDAASGGDLVITDYQQGILALPQRPLTIADLMASGTTGSNAVGFMKEVTATNAAAAVAEGATKPESTLVFDAASDPVRKIATWLPVTEEILEDVPAMRGYIDTRLRLFVLLAEDDQLLNGDGVAPNVSGILDRAGIAAPIARTTETNPDVILAQISAIENATNLPVDGIALHPNQWNGMLTLKDANGQYVAGGGPFGTMQRKVLWGRSVAVTPAVTAGTAVVGAWKTASQLFRKGVLRVEASNSHANFFVENKIAIRAEERVALVVYREAAFGRVTNLT